MEHGGELGHDAVRLLARHEQRAQSDELRVIYQTVQPIAADYAIGVVPFLLINHLHIVTKGNLNFLARAEQ
jgi:hypothetical protein